MPNPSNNQIYNILRIWWLAFRGRGASAGLILAVSGFGAGFWRFAGPGPDFEVLPGQGLG